MFSYFFQKQLIKHLQFFDLYQTVSFWLEKNRVEMRWYEFAIETRKFSTLSKVEKVENAQKSRKNSKFSTSLSIFYQVTVCTEPRNKINAAVGNFRAGKKYFRRCLQLIAWIRKTICQIPGTAHSKKTYIKFQNAWIIGVEGECWSPASTK